jgi:hypothetical protein
VEEPQRSNRFAALGGYKMKLEKFTGSASEDYDLWWADLRRSKVELVLSNGSQFSEFIFIFSGSEF